MNVLLQYPEDNVITMSWDNSDWLQYFESIHLEDSFGGQMVSVDMLSSNTLVLDNPAFNTLVINFTPSGGTPPPQIILGRGWYRLRTLRSIPGAGTW